MQIEIIFENDDLLVINKPAGVVVNRADSVQQQTIQDYIDETFDYELAHDFLSRNGIVHRLDKDTSGVMVLAKNLSTMQELQRQFKERETRKTYIALVHGTFRAKEGTFTAPMERSKFDRKKYIVGVGGKMTETHYNVLKEYQRLVDKKLMVKGYQGFSLVELHPKTGRTHQIRVIMTHLKHPLVGDAKYVGRKRAKADIHWCERHFLHAKELCINLPKSNISKCFVSELPVDLQKTLELLEIK